MTEVINGNNVTTEELSYPPIQSIVDIPTGASSCVVVPKIKPSEKVCMTCVVVVPTTPTAPKPPGTKQTLITGVTWIGNKTKTTSVAPSRTPTLITGVTWIGNKTKTISVAPYRTPTLITGVTRASFKTLTVPVASVTGYPGVKTARAVKKQIQPIQINTPGIQTKTQTPAIIKRAAGGPVVRPSLPNMKVPKMPVMYDQANTPASEAAVASVKSSVQV